MIPCDTLILIVGFLGVIAGVAFGWIAFAPMGGGK